MLPESVTIGDFVWLDVNGDGLQDEDEPGIANIVVVLRDPSDAEVARDVTDQFGEYTFDVAPGSYLLEVELPDEFGITRTDEGPGDELDSDLTVVDDLERTARTDVFAAPTEHPDGFDLGLISVPTPPTTEPPTTASPTTEEPTTTAPTTVAPTTAVPTTIAPTTAVATTVAPTAPPSTEAPTTTVATTPPPPTTTPDTTTPDTTTASPGASPGG